MLFDECSIVVVDGDAVDDDANGFVCDGVVDDDYYDDDGAIGFDAVAVVVDGDGDESDVDNVEYSTTATCQTNCLHFSRM